MSNSRDTLGEASVRRLNARSLALSALLGTHPPTLPASSLVAMAELFGISGGSMRTALSRLAAAGDVTVEGGHYTLASRLVERQVAQDAGRRAPSEPWDGTWHIAVAIADQRVLADRRHVRAVMANARFAELRPTVWMRPSNLPAPSLGDDWITSTGPIDGDEVALAARLWDLEEAAATARRLSSELDRAKARIDRSTDLHAGEEVPATFTLSASIVRFLRSEPLLPQDLTPVGWPLPDLRQRYDRFEQRLQTMMRPILRSEPPG